MGKFEEELKEIKVPSIVKVAEYLLKREDIKSNLEKENKSLKEMWNYICGEAKKLADNNCACVTDETVYEWAVHYYDEDNIKVESLKNINVKTKVTKEKEVKKDVPKKSKKEKKDTIEGQLSLFDAL